MTDKSDLTPYIEMETEIVNTTRGKETLSLKKYSYIFDKFRTDRSRKFWRFEHKSVCVARLHTSVADGRVMKQLHEHNHGSDVAQTEVSKIVDSVRRLAGEKTEIP